MAEQNKKDELVNAIGEAGDAIIKQWGNVFDTPFGSLYYSSSGAGTYLVFRGKHQHGEHNLWWWKKEAMYISSLGISALQAMADGVQALALYLVSDDFSKKLDGSMRRLKGVTKALKS